MEVIRRHVDRRALLLAGVAVAVLIVVFASPQLLGDQVRDALRALADANPALLWLAGACFLTLLVSMGAAWRAAVLACEGDVDHVGAVARFAAGSFAAALVPAGAGGAVRIALFSRRLPPGERLWQAGGISAAIAAARALSLAAVAAIAAALGALPVWPVALMLGAVALAVAAAFWIHRHPAHSHLAHVFDVFGSLVDAPRRAVELVGWTTAATLARLGGAVSIAAALGVSSPLTAGLVAVAALAVAGLIQLTPANLGVGSGALAIALNARGVDMTTALSTGIAFQAVETVVSLLVGGAAVLYLARVPVPRWALRAGGAFAGVLVAGAFGVTVFFV
jgi:uncharacterized membrane protein YbhN (UPF0104 family)